MAIHYILAVHSGDYNRKGSEARRLGRTTNPVAARREAVTMQNVMKYSEVFAMPAGKARRFYKIDYGCTFYND